MQPTGTTVHSPSNDNNSATAVPLHQYVTDNRPSLNNQSVQIASKPLVAGLFGLIVASTGTMGANLHKVKRDEMTLPEAAGDAVANGLIGGAATASATAVAGSLTNGGAAGLALTLAAATGASFLLHQFRQP